MPDAEASFGRALALARGLVDQTGVPADSLVLAGILCDLGKLRRVAGDFDGAAAEFEKALTICRKIPPSGPDGSTHVDVRFRMARCLASLGLLAQIKGDDPRAAELLGQAHSDLDKLVDESPTVEHRYEAASVDQSLGKLLARSKDQRDRARSVFQDALKHWEVLAEQYPESPAYRWGIAATRQNLGDIDNTALHSQGDPKAARRSYEEALKIWESEAAKPHALTLFAFNVARTRFELGRLCLQEKRRDEARTHLQEARGIWESLTEDEFRREYEVGYRDYLKNYLAELEQPPPSGPEAKEANGGKRPAP